ncbi:hypothetical protein PGB90_001534 [Kerria lacca]
MGESTIVCEESFATLIRYFMVNRQIEEDTLTQICAQIFSEGKTLANIIQAANTILDDSKMKIQSALCEVTSGKYYVLISTHFRPDSLWPNKYTNIELEYIKSIINELVISDTGMISLMKCLNLEMKMNKTDAQNLIKNLIVEKWLIEPYEGKLALSALSITELEPYFKQNYESLLNTCIFCQRNIFFGEICVNCNSIGHRACITKYQELMKNRFRCPSCGKNWNQLLHRNPDEAMQIIESN